MAEDIYDGDSLVRGDVKVEWVYCDEGLCEEYNPNDPHDVALLRFDVWLRGVVKDRHDVYDPEEEWSTAQDFSYCTQFLYDATEEQRRAGLKLLMDAVYDDAVAGNHLKRICERLSWISLESLDAGKVEMHIVEKFK